jgi:hypothetical protein
MLNRDFKECVASFNAHGVECLVVGGYALAALKAIGSARWPSPSPT